MVPPTTRPRGYHAVGSNQFQKACKLLGIREHGGQTKNDLHRNLWMPGLLWHDCKANAINVCTVGITRFTY